MEVTSEKNHSHRPTASLSDFFTGYHFAAFSVILILVFDLALLYLIFAPAGEDQMGQFLEDFRLWCLGYNPETGGYNLIYPVVFYLESLLLMGVFCLIWKQELIGLVRPVANLKKVVPHFMVAVIAIFLAAYSLQRLYPVGTGEHSASLGNFDVRELRTTLNMHQYSFINHAEQTVTSAFNGKIRVITSFFAHCVHTCPLILSQIKRILNELDSTERQMLEVHAITMDPERDNPHHLKEAAEIHGLELPLIHLLTGDSKEINRTLDDFNFSRKKDEETGDYDHANLFLLVDKNDKVAFRFALGDQQEKLMVKALRILINEL